MKKPENEAVRLEAVTGLHIEQTLCPTRDFRVTKQIGEHSIIVCLCSSLAEAVMFLSGFKCSQTISV